MNMRHLTRQFIFQVRFSDALDFLAWETTHWGAQVESMLHYGFNGLSKELILYAGDFVRHRYPTINCENLEMEQSILGDLINSASNGSDLLNSTVTFWNYLTLDQINPRFPKFPKGTCAQGGPTCQVSFCLLLN
jgi:hypothetical protein